MNKRSYRRFTTDEKRMILTEVQQPGVTLSEVCRKHSVSPALVYHWRAVAQQATTQALQTVDSRGRANPMHKLRACKQSWTACAASSPRSPQRTLS